MADLDLHATSGDLHFSQPSLNDSLVLSGQKLNEIIIKLKLRNITHLCLGPSTICANYSYVILANCLK